MGRDANGSVPLVSIIRIGSGRTRCPDGPCLLETSCAVYGSDKCRGGKVGKALEGMERERPGSGEQIMS